ncbi:hypothetical protein WA026_015043 [Henosepilachna vigintioctopunctata]|uniref:Secreted protein n=1 Tax=Henosepilachna vigintioctopunctata TaxID=420089 RepID=A0AAW1U2T5_9CUCU
MLRCGKMASFFNLVIMTIVLSIVGVKYVSSKPGLIEEYWNTEDKCKSGVDEVLETCQRCAKQTKSPIVYPMCCANDDDAYYWCARFINFGQQEKH